MATEVFELKPSKIYLFSGSIEFLPDVEPAGLTSWVPEDLRAACQSGNAIKPVKGFISQGCQTKMARLGVVGENDGTILGADYNPI